MAPTLTVIGGGLAGCEAAWQAAERGLRVRLFEMRPGRMTPAHHSGQLAEIVCSNSLRGDSLENAPGLLKAELRRLGSLIIRAADANRIPGGGSLIVDRHGFAGAVTTLIEEHPGIEVVRAEVTSLPDDLAVIASGPLTSPSLAEALARFTGERYLYFFDAAAPVVTADSIDFGKAFTGSRYGKGDGDAYVNCPMTEEEYGRFRAALLEAETAERKPFDPVPFFEGCLPVEEMARRGRDTLRYGPLKPVGITDPRSGVRPHAVVQLRQDDREGRLFNMVGFQTTLKWGEQERVFRLIPGLERAEFVRFGVVHRNLFICSPRLLTPTMRSRRRPGLLFAGQVTGVEGYIESAATGLVAGLNAARIAWGEEPLVFPADTAIGALCHYVSTANPETFQPMNVAFGLLPPPPPGGRGRRQRRLSQAQRALRSLEDFCGVAGLPGNGAP